MHNAQGQLEQGRVAGPTSFSTRSGILTMTRTILRINPKNRMRTFYRHVQKVMVMQEKAGERRLIVLRPHKNLYTIPLRWGKLLTKGIRPIRKMMTVSNNHQGSTLWWGFTKLIQLKMRSLFE